VTPQASTPVPETGRPAAGHSTLDGPPPDRAVPGRTRWWRRPWVGPFAVVAVTFVAFSLPPYLTLDPGQSRVPRPDGFPPHFPLLVGHVVFGSVALLTCGLQVWPWFRERYPTAHRRVGRVYVLGGVLPAGVLGLTIGAMTPFGPVARASNVLMATLWLAITITGFRMARQGRYVEHRRWMIRSFALTASIITNRVWGAVGVITLSPQLETTFGGDETLLVHAIAGMTTWLGWTIPLLLAEWWLERDLVKRPRRRAGVAAD
jgi:uncharacterized membrane protein